jgi:hypothetical protein
MVGAIYVKQGGVRKSWGATPSGPFGGVLLHGLRRLVQVELKHVHPWRLAETHRGILAFEIGENRLGELSLCR